MVVDGNEELGEAQLDLLDVMPTEQKVSIFQQTTVAEAKSLTDGFDLGKKYNNIILPFVGYGTYKLGREIARSQTLEALRQGYRCIDTAFIYGGESTEKQVGLAIQGKLGVWDLHDEFAIFEFGFFAISL